MNILFLNLLSPEKKKRINELVNFIMIKNLLEITVFIVATAGIFILGGWLVVVSGYNELTKSAISISKEYVIQNQETRDINRTLHNINNSAENYSPIMEKLAELTNATPDGIKLNLINFNKSNRSITISGNATDRAVLLNYQTTLENIAWLDQINAPSSQLFQKENIYFELTAKLSNPSPPQEPTANQK